MYLSYPLLRFTRCFMRLRPALPCVSAGDVTLFRRIPCVSAGRCHAPVRFTRMTHDDVMRILVERAKSVQIRWSHKYEYVPAHLCFLVFSFNPKRVQIRLCFVCVCNQYIYKHIRNTLRRLKWCLCPALSSGEFPSDLVVVGAGVNQVGRSCVYVYVCDKTHMSMTAPSWVPSIVGVLHVNVISRALSGPAFAVVSCSHGRRR